MNRKNIGLLMIGVALVFMGCPNPPGGDESLDYTSSNIGILNYVPSGTFQRDDTETNTSTVSAFRMSEHEITRTQFEAIMGTDPSNTIYASGASDPVQWVTSYHAIAFCNKLSITEGLDEVYSITGVDFTTLTFANIPDTSSADWDAATADWTANGYRLPSEMEWMWAAMGAEDARNKAFAGSTGSNSIGDYAVFGYYGTETGRTTAEMSNPVGSKSANELGLYDMSGNVGEWCWDWLGTYPAGAVTDYRGAASGDYRVFRGGDWGNNAAYCAVTYRFYDASSSRGNRLGFRVVRL
jgi:sulfatase modifying factor 1